MYQIKFYNDEYESYCKFANNQIVDEKAMYDEILTMTVFFGDIFSDAILIVDMSTGECFTCNEFLDK